MSIVASAVLQFYNKPNPPAVMQVHENGEVTILKTLADAKITYGQATDIAYLRKYVNFRESYDWETIQDLYNATILLSSPKEASLYVLANGEGNRMAPVNVLRDKIRVIATAGTVSFVGNTALVSFAKKSIPLNGQPPAMDYFIATITYEYSDQPMKDADRGINVAGFKVTSYRVDRDITKASAITTATSERGGS
jgi:type IV secretion system protein VirB8